jgi:hypothetical protein
MSATPYSRAICLHAVPSCASVPALGPTRPALFDAALRPFASPAQLLRLRPSRGGHTPRWGSPPGGVPRTHGHDRLCWLSQIRADQRFWMRSLEVRETEDISLVKRTPMVLDVSHCDLPNRVTTSFTPVGNCPDSPKPILRPSPATGHDAEMLEV